MKKLILLASLLAASTHTLAATANQAELTYRGPYGVSARMSFQRSASHYSVVTQSNLPGYKIQFASNGSIQNNVLHTVRYTDTRNGSVYSSTNVNYASRSARFGKTTDPKDEKISGAVQDMFALAWQVALDPAKLAQVRHITNGKSLYPVSRVSSAGAQSMKVGARSVSVKLYHAYRQGSTITLGIAPELNNIPVLIEYQDDGKDYKLVLTSATVDGQRY